MDISVIIPIYNVEEYIEQCLCSLFNQTKTEGVEFILIDDSSTDKSLSISKEVACRYPHLEIIIIENKINQGIGTVRNIGISKIRGTYSIHVDGDDWCELDMLEALYSKAIETSADIVVCDYYDSYKNGDVYRSQELQSGNIENIQTLLNRGLFGSLWNKLVKTSLYRENGINHTTGVNHQGDLVLSIKLFYFADKVAKLSQSFIHYRQRAGSIMKKGLAYKVRFLINNINEIEDFCEEKRISKQIGRYLAEMKINLKFNIAVNSRGVIRRKYLKYFPEVDHEVKNSLLSKKQQTLLLLAISDYSIVIDTITILSRIRMFIRNLVGNRKKRPYELY